MKYGNGQTYISRDERIVEVELPVHSSTGDKNYAYIYAG
jgi:hypothetical protein